MKRSLNRARRLSVLLACVALGVFGVPRGAQSQPAPYEIDAILSLTGPGAFLAKAQATSLGVLEQYVNKQGGIKGRPIKFAIADDQSTPAVAVQLLNAAVARKAAVVLGSSIAATCNAMAPLIPNGPVVYCFSGGVQPAKGSYMFAFGGGLGITIPVGLRYLRERGLKKIAILTTTDASGKDGERNVDLALALPENRDVTVVAREYFTPGDVSVAAQVAKIKASGAQAVTV
jgi:branched-chain amino acid transport system substrate-binding protein